MESRCPLNVPGPFYTCGQCLACAAPEHEAPTLLAALDANNAITYFVRQPTNEKEVAQACNAIRVCCVGDLRYGGTDLSIIERLGNTAQHSDYVITSGELTFVGRPSPALTSSSWWQRTLGWMKRRLVRRINPG